MKKEEFLPSEWRMPNLASAFLQIIKAIMQDNQQKQIILVFEITKIMQLKKIQMYSG